MTRTISRFFAIAGLACLLIAPAATAQLAQVDMGGSDILWHPNLDASEWTLTVHTPDGLFTETFAGDETPSFALRSVAGLDGTYQWELVRTPSFSASHQAEMAEARANGVTPKNAGEILVRQSGSFTVAGGAIVTEALVEAPASGPSLASAGNGTAGSGTASAGSVATKDQFFADDVIVDGSLCVGMDCVNGENFGFDTLRLKENNLRIHFDDTSNSGSFPNVDWRLTANDSSNGGANYFSIDDATNGRVPFRVDAASKNNSLRVLPASSGQARVAIGADSSPTTLRMVDGNTPSLRLEQDGSSGFNPQTWDVAGNEVNFFVRDVTNGSKLPFRIEPNSPENSIYIDSTSRVGMGTNSPSQSLHMRGTAGNSQLLIEETNATETGRILLALQNNGGTNMQFVDTSADGGTWQLITQTTVQNGGFSISFSGSGAREFRIEEDGDAFVAKDLDVVGTVFATSVDTSSSRTLKENFVTMDPAEVLARAVELPVTMWNYKRDDDSLRHIGPMAEDFHAAFGVGNSDKTITVSDSFGVALAAIQGLNEVVESKDAEIAQLNQRLEQLEAIVEQLANDN